MSEKNTGGEEENTTVIGLRSTGSDKWSPVKKRVSNGDQGEEKKSPEAEFKEFEPRFEFKRRLYYGWFHIKLYQMFQDLSRSSIKTGF